MTGSMKQTKKEKKWKEGKKNKIKRDNITIVGKKKKVNEKAQVKSLIFSSQFGEIDFWWAQEKNT